MIGKGGSNPGSEHDGQTTLRSCVGHRGRGEASGTVGRYLGSDSLGSIQRLGRDGRVCVGILVSGTEYYLCTILAPSLSLVGPSVASIVGYLGVGKQVAVVDMQRGI